MPRNQLDRLSQVIHDDTAQPLRRYFLTSNTNGRPATSWKLHLFTTTSSGSLQVWMCSVDSDDVSWDENEAEAAIKHGYLHVDGDPTIDKTLRVSGIDARRADEKLQIMLQHETESYELVRGDDLEVSGARLLEAALRLQALPTSDTDRSAEIRSLRAQLSEKDVEITSLHAKLASMKATVARSTGTDKKKVVSPRKKASASASALQPNAKRRRAAEDEFAGSDEDDE